MGEIPLEPFDSNRSIVIDIGEFRIRHGRTPYKEEKRLCLHKNLIISSSERRVWCEDCNKTIEPMDAVLSLFNVWQKLEAHYSAEHHKINEGRDATLVRRASKAIDREWGRKMGVCCPHCRRGIFPEDIGDFAPATVSREYENAMRKRSATKAPAPPPCEEERK